MVVLSQRKVVKDSRVLSVSTSGRVILRSITIARKIGRLAVILAWYSTSSLGPCS